VARYIEENFLPVRVHVKDQAGEFRRLSQRFGARWTPTLLEIDPQGNERHRVEGFLPAEELLAQLMLGLAHDAFRREDWSEAERRFHEILERLPGVDAAPEAEYWAGVSRYKATGDAHALEEVAEFFSNHYRDSAWARRASVWARPAA
jgi:hypothetical protein